MTKDLFNILKRDLFNKEANNLSDDNLKIASIIFKEKLKYILDNKSKFIEKKYVYKGVINKISFILDDLLDFDISDKNKKEDELVKYAYKIQQFSILYQFFDNKNFFIKELYEFGKKLDLLSRDNLDKKILKKERKGDIKISDNYFEKLKIKNDNIVYHPDENLQQTIGGFLENIYLDKKIEKVFISLYGMEENYLMNPVFRQIIKLSSKKQVTVFIDPKSKGLNTENILNFKSMGINVIIPNIRLHGKFIYGEGKNCKSKYLISSGNFIREDVKTEDITIYGKGEKNGYSKELKKICKLISGKEDFKNEKFNNLIVTPFGGKEKILDLISNEIKEHKEKKDGNIYISTTTFYDLDVYNALKEASKSGVKINVVVRTDLIYFDDNIKNFTISKREINGKTKQHARFFKFGSQNILIAGSIGCNTMSHKGIDISFIINIDKQFNKYISKTLNESSIVSK